MADQEQTQTAQPMLVTVEEIARLLSMGRTTIYELVQYQGMPVYRFGKSIRFSVPEVQAWLENRKGE